MTPFHISRIKSYKSFQHKYMKVSAYSVHAHSAAETNKSMSGLCNVRRN